MLKSKDVLKKTGSIIDLQGENINKLTSVILEGFNLLIDLGEDLLNLNYLEDLKGNLLDKFGEQFSISRINNMADNDYRNYIKAYLFVRTKGGTFNNIVNALSLMFGIDKKLVQLTESEISRHIKVMIINSAIDKDILLEFIKAVKAAGIILDCYEYLVNEPVYEYDTFEYDSIFFPVSLKSYLINCRGESHEISESNEIIFEYDRHEYDISSSNLNDK